MISFSGKTIVHAYFQEQPAPKLEAISVILSPENLCYESQILLGQAG